MALVTKLMISCESRFFSVHRARREAGNKFQLYVVRLQFQFQGAFQFFKLGVEFDVGVLELECTGFYFRQVEDVTDEL